MILDQFAAQITAASQKYGVREAFIRADIMHESGGNPFAVGDGGLALGLMQTHPGAAKDVGGDWNALKAAIDAKDTEKAVQLGLAIGVPYLARMLKLFGYDEQLALMAFNQGPGVIGRAKAYADAVLKLETKS